MFNLRGFILRGLKQSVGIEAEYKIIERAVGWLDKGVLTESDLIYYAIDSRLTNSSQCRKFVYIDIIFFA